MTEIGNPKTDLTPITAKNMVITTAIINPSITAPKPL